MVCKHAVLLKFRNTCFNPPLNIFRHNFGGLGVLSIQWYTFQSLMLILSTVQMNRILKGIRPSHLPGTPVTAFCHGDKIFSQILHPPVPYCVSLINVNPQYRSHSFFISLVLFCGIACVLFSISCAFCGTARVQNSLNFIHYAHLIIIVIN